MLEKFWNLSFVKRTKAFLERRRAFNSKNSWWDFLTKTYNKLTDNDTSERAASVTFNLMLAVFPTIIFLFTLIPYIPYPNLEADIMGFLERILPKGTYVTVDQTVRDIVSRKQGGILSFGFLLALYSATSGMLALINAFNSSHQTGEGRTFLKTRLVAAGLTVVLAIGLFLAIAGLVIGGVVIDFLLRFGVFDNIVFFYIFKIARYLIVFAVFVGVVAVIYRFGPDFNMKWRFITPGVIIAAVLIVLASLGFSYYVSNFGSYNKVYGSIGTLIVLMVWLNLVSLLIIMGFEMNVSLYNLEGDQNPSVAEKTVSTEASSEMAPHESEARHQEIERAPDAPAKRS